MLVLKEIDKEHVLQVKKVLFENINFLLNGLPETLRDFLKNNAILSGGAIP